MGNTKIIGTGRYVGGKHLSNDELAKVVDTSDEWISTRTGIKKRWISENENTSEIGLKAAREAIKNAGVGIDDIDLIIVATITPDSFTPSTACIIQGKLGAKNAFAFDISAACSGFVYALTCADKFIKSGQCKTALIIGAETLSKIVDFEDRTTCVLFGDGAGAAVLRASDEAGGIMQTHLGSDGEFGVESLNSGEFKLRNILTGDVSKDKIALKMDGKSVFRFSVKMLPENVTKMLQLGNLTLDDIKYIVPHQANLRIVESAAKRLGATMDKFYMNISEYGNTSGATIPMALAEMNEKKLLEKGDKIILVGFGGGLTWGSALIEW